MAVGAVSTYAAVAAFPVNVIVIAALYCVLGLASSGTWLGFGARLQRIAEERSGRPRVQHRDGAAARRVAVPDLRRQPPAKRSLIAASRAG